MVLTVAMGRGEMLEWGETLGQIEQIIQLIQSRRISEGHAGEAGHTKVQGAGEVGFDDF